MTRQVLLAELTSEELHAHLEAGAVALIPVGATEAHGPHLPLDTDVIIAEETCRRAAPLIRERLGLTAAVLPPLAYSLAEFAGPFPGTVSIPREVIVPYVRSVLISVASMGFRAVILVNGHVEPAHRFTLRDAVKEARDTASCPLGLADPADKRFAGRLTEEFASGSCHAGQYETSLILAAQKERVKKSFRTLPGHHIDLLGAIKSGARSFAEAGAPDAYCGDPAQASIEEGEWCYTQLAEIVATVTSETLGDPNETK